MDVGVMSKTRTRTKYRHICRLCRKPFESADRYRTYCSHSCSAKVTNKSRASTDNKSECLWCFGLCSKKLCSKSCKDRYLVYEWLAGRTSGSTKYGPRAFVYKYILSRSGGRCEGIDSRTGVRCVEDRIVHLDHINGIHEDNSAENLRHLCPTCHALTSTYGSKNRGDGRVWKNEYLKEQNKYRKLILS